MGEFIFQYFGIEGGELPHPSLGQAQGEMPVFEE